MNITLPKHDRIPTPVQEEPEEFWDDDAIQAVIRAAAVRGVSPTEILDEPDAYQRFGDCAATVRLG